MKRQDLHWENKTCKLLGSIGLLCGGLRGEGERKKIVRVRTQNAGVLVPLSPDFPRYFPLPLERLEVQLRQWKMQSDLSSWTDCGRPVKNFVSVTTALWDVPSVIKWHLIGSLSNDFNSNINENDKKAIGFNFARASRLFVYFFVPTARLRRENN